MTVTTQRDSEKITTWDHMRNQSATPIGVANTQNRALPKLMVWFTLFVSVIYLVYTLKLISSTRACHDDFLAADIHHHRRLRLPIRSPETTPNSTFSSEEQSIPTQIVPKNETTAETHLRKELKLNEIVFGIAASAKYWEERKNYIQLWWKPEKMRGVVWLDSPVKTHGSDLLPPVRISGNTSKFAYKNKQGHRSAIRISRIVSETLRLGGNGNGNGFNGMKNVKWFVMGDDDTVFVTENLIRVLEKYDYNEMYYIGGISESHLQNIYFSYGMAYGGGGFAISYPLAKALEKMQDECIGRYSGLYGSDDRMQACMAELGVPLTKELGFHQFDVYGNLFGLLAAHPVTPLVTLHHLDVVEPIFPNVTRVQALRRLTIPMKLDSAGLMQQSICYDKAKKWTVSVSWGFAVQIYRGVLSPREMEMPSRTFLNWYRRADYTAYAFNTRPVGRNPCQRSFVFYLSKAGLESSTNLTVSDYIRHRVPHPLCKWKMQDPAEIERVKVYKKPDPHLWERSPRRNCCRILESKRSSMVVDVGVCREGEFSEI